MSEKKRRLLTVIPAACAAIIPGLILVLQSVMSEGVRGMLVGICLGAAVGAFIKVKRASTDA
jgi:hypothetical protein